MNKRVLKLIIFILLLSAILAGTVLAKEVSLNINGTHLPVYTLQKAGNDNENFIILILGDGYTDTEQEKFLEDVLICSDTLLKTEPFVSYSDKINVYAVSAISEESGISVYEGMRKNTYFGLLHWGNIVSLSEVGETRANRIKQELEKNYLDSSAAIGTTHILSNTSYRFGTSTTAAYSYSSMPENDRSGSAFVHETAHSIGRIRDEYGHPKDSVNTSSTGNLDTVPWKKMLGFRKVGVAYNDYGSNIYVPALQCNMRNEAYLDFCEVCRLELVKYMNMPDYTQAPLEYYVANPDLTIEHGIEAVNDNEYNKYHVINGNLKKANKHNLELRTIVQNFTTDEKRLKLSLKIIDENGNNKYFKEKEFVIPGISAEDLSDSRYEQAKQSISVVIENVQGIGHLDTVLGEVIDCETNKVVANDKIGDTKKAELRINHKLKLSDGTIKPIPNAMPTSVYVPVGTSYLPKTLKQLSGYIYVGNSMNGGMVTVDKNGAEIDFYYTEPNPSINAKFSADGKEIELSAQDILDGSAVVLALYNGDYLTEAKHFIYNGETIKYTTLKDYTSVKVMVWKSLANLEPVYISEYKKQTHPFDAN